MFFSQEILGRYNVASGYVFCKVVIYLFYCERRKTCLIAPLYLFVKFFFLEQTVIIEKRINTNYTKYKTLLKEKKATFYWHLSSTEKKVNL